MKRNDGVRKLRYGLTENQNTCIYRMELSNVVHVWRNGWVRNIIIYTVMMGLHVNKERGANSEKSVVSFVLHPSSFLVE